MSTRQTSRVKESAASNGGRGDSPASGENGAGDNVDKIRELLFGEQMVGYEARFKALESKLIEEAEALRQSVEDTVTELRAQFEKRSDEIEDASVPRKEIATALEKLADKIRG